MYTEKNKKAGAGGRKIGVAVSQYHDSITNLLLEGAKKAFDEAGGDEQNLIIVPTPGAFELIAVVRAFTQRDDLDGIVALGCVLTGETPHDRYISHAVAQGLASLTVQTGLPIAFGLLTCQTMAQAKARSGGSVGNKGEEAVTAVLDVIQTLADMNAAEGKA